MLLAQATTARNRALVQKLFNGDSPYTDEERLRENIKTNVNFLEGPRIASNSTSQLNNAFLKSDRYFTVTLDKGPIHKRSQWAASITKHLNAQLKKNWAYKSSIESSHAQVVLHGPAPRLWKNRRHPCPKATAVDDVILPAGTLVSMENLDRFGVYTELTWNQLYELTQGKAADPGWNKEYVKAIMATLYKTGVQPIYQGNRWMFPEKIQEDIKEGAGLSASSSLPKCMAWQWFYREEDNDKWCRKIALDWNSMVGAETSPFKKSDSVFKEQGFLYEKEDYADDWSEIIQWRIGNCSNVAPYRYYSIRSVGYLLYGICLIQNKVRNRTYDHTLQALMTWFRNVSEDNREKLGMIDLQNFGIMPDGLSLVTANERHEVDWNLVMMSLNQGRQLMAESSQSFVPDMPGGPQKEMTATETLVRQNTSTNLTSAVLNQLGDQSTFEYREIARRFCIKTNPDPMCVKFRKCIEQDGVPLDMLDIEYWDIKPEMAVGGGSKAVELTVTQAAMQEIFPLVGPDGQRIILRRRYLALTDNPEEAQAIVPDAPEPPSDDIQYAQMAFTVLMLGMPFMVKEGINHVAYAGMLMTMMDAKLKLTQQVIGTPSGVPIAAESIAGMMNVANHLQQEIQIIGSQGDRGKQLAAQFEKVLGELFKALMEMGKQVSEMAQQSQEQGGISPEAQAKIQTMIATAQTKSQIDTMKAQQKEELKRIGWLEENERRNATTSADIQRKNAQTMVDLQSQQVLAEAQAEQIRNKPQPAGKE